MKYSLVEYLLTITFPAQMEREMGIKTLTIGGEGSYTDSFEFNQSRDVYSTTGDATGSWIHSKSMDRTGTAAISLSQVSNQIVQLTRLFNLYYNSDVIDEGVTITLRDNSSKTIATCNDCFITKVPAINIRETPQNRTWTFTCGQIIIN